MVTDYDCWKEHEEAVTVEMIIQNLTANAAAAKRTIALAVSRIADADCACQHALATAFITDRKLWPPKAKRDLAPMLKKYL
jgi:5'-methylthioadenosine phosphorylase